MGFKLGLIDCTTAPCDENPCLNGGLCVLDGSDLRCQCTPDWTGDLCQRGMFLYLMCVTLDCIPVAVITFKFVCCRFHKTLPNLGLS